MVIEPTSGAGAHAACSASRKRASSSSSTSIADLTSIAAMSAGYSTSSTCQDPEEWLEALAEVGRDLVRRRQVARPSASRPARKAGDDQVARPSVQSISVSPQSNRTASKSS